MIQVGSQIGLGALALLASASAPQLSQDSLLQRFDGVDLVTIPLPQITQHAQGVFIRGMRGRDVERLQTLARRLGDNVNPSVLDRLRVGPEVEIMVPTSPRDENLSHVGDVDRIDTLADLYQLRSLLLCFESLRDLAQAPRLVDSRS